MRSRLFRGAVVVEEFGELAVRATLVEGWGDDGSALEWHGRAIHGRVGWKGSLVGDARWEVALAEKTHLTLRFPNGDRRRFLVAYVNNDEGTADVCGEGDLPEATVSTGGQDTA